MTSCVIMPTPPNASSRRLRNSVGLGNPWVLIDNTPAADSWRALTLGAALPRVVMVMLCIAVHAMDVFVTATILPTVVVDIGGAAFYAWPTAIYVVTAIMGTASGGRMEANLGMRRALIAAASIYLVGSLVCAIAPNMTVFLVGRVGQGLGGGLLASLAYVMIRGLFSEQMRPRVFALISMMWGVSAMIGPLLGGLFAELDFWRGVYWLTVPIFVMLTTLAWRSLPPQDVTSETSRQPWGCLFLLGATVMSVIFSGQTDALTPRVILIVGAVIGVAVMLWFDHRAANPLFPTMPLSLRHPVGTGFLVLFIFAFSFTPINIFLPLLAQRLHDVPPSLAGYVGATMSFGWTVAAILVPGAGPRMQRRLMVTGPACLIAGIIGQTYVVVDGPIGVLIAFVFLMGLGVGQCHAHVSNRIMINARPGEDVLTAGSIPTMQSLGIAFGAAIGGLLANAGGLSEGLTTAAIISATDWIYGFCIFPAVLLLLVALRLVWLLRKTEPSLD
jgi:MFS family permease